MQTAVTVSTLQDTISRAIERFPRERGRIERAATKRILGTEPPSAEVVRRFPLYAEMVDPIERRGAILRLHAEGWNNTSIAGYLGTTRRRVYETLKRWWDEGPSGLEDKAPIPHQTATKNDLWSFGAFASVDEREAHVRGR